MKKAPPCFELIKAMDKAEKIYFKRFFSGQSNVKESTSYIKLFNELDKMKTYDLTKLQRKFAKEKLLDHLSVTFNYLYNILLNCLYQFHKEKDNRLKAEAMLGEIRILFKKRLLDQCERYIKRAKKFMLKQEYYFYLYLLIAFEYNIVIIRMKKNEFDLLMNLNDERKKYLKYLDNELSIISINNSTTKLIRDKRFNNEKDITAEVQLIEKELVELDLAEGTTFYKLRYLNIQQELFYLQEQYLKSLQASHDYVLLKRNLPEHLQYDLNSDSIAIKNHVQKAVEFWFVDEIPFWIPHLEFIQDKRPDLSHKCRLLISHFQFRKLLIRSEFEAMHNFMTSINSEWNDLVIKNVDYYRIWLFENRALYSFITENMNDCLIWIGDIYNQKDIDDSVRLIMINLRFLEIMAHFQLENYQLIPSLCLSTERAIKKLHDDGFQLKDEILFLKQMKTIENFNFPKEKKIFFSKITISNQINFPFNIRKIIIDVWKVANINDTSIQKTWTTNANEILDYLKKKIGKEKLTFTDS